MLFFLWGVEAVVSFQMIHQKNHWAADLRAAERLKLSPTQTPTVKLWSHELLLRSHIQRRVKPVWSPQTSSVTAADSTGSNTPQLRKHWLSWNQNQSHFELSVPQTTFAATKTTFHSQVDLRVSLYLSYKDNHAVVLCTRRVRPGAFGLSLTRGGVARDSFPGTEDVAGVNLHLTAEGGWRRNHRGHR